MLLSNALLFIDRDDIEVVNIVVCKICGIRVTKFFFIAIEVIYRSFAVTIKVLISAYLLFASFAVRKLST